MLEQHSPTALQRPRAATPTGDRQYAEALIRRIVDACPRRAPTSEQELQAQRMLQEELNTRGVRTHLLPFRFNANLYAVLALHFGVALLGSIVYFYSPIVALGLHLLAGVSYLSEASHWGYILRRLFPWRRSQNLVGKLPAVGKPRLRIVLLGHADAAHTGVMFNPLMVSGTSNKPAPQPFGFVRKHMLFAVIGFFALVTIDVMTLATGEWLSTMFVGLNFGLLIGFVLNMQVVLKNTIVPGASDNLTGCAALPVLASRFADKKPDDVEMVFVATGCEESGVGGSAALMRQMRKKWDREDTVIIALDILANGQLCYKTVNEVLPYRIPAWLVETMQDVAKKHENIGELGIYDACAGTDDAVPFIIKGYDGICLARSDPKLGVSQQYHLMSDRPDNVDFAQLAESIDFTEDVVEEVIRRRLAEDAPLDKRRIVATLDERPTGAFAIFTKWWVWPILGAIAGAYYAAVMYLDWPITLHAFRGAMSTLVLWFPISVVLGWLGWHPDEKRGGNLIAFGVVSAVGIGALGMIIPAAAAALLPQFAGLPTSTLAAWGMLIGAVAALPIGWRFSVSR